MGVNYLKTKLKIIYQVRGQKNYDLKFPVIQRNKNRHNQWLGRMSLKQAGNRIKKIMRTV